MVALNGQYEGEESTFEPIPPGEYPMHITTSEMVKTSNGTGQYLKLELEIVDGAQAGRKLTERLNLINPNSQAVEIAQRTLRGIVFACGLGSCTDSEQLHMRRMNVSVGVEERNDKPGQFTNRIKGYKPGGAAAGGQSAGSGAAPPAQQQQRAAAGGGGATPPWKR